MGFKYGSLTIDIDFTRHPFKLNLDKPVYFFPNMLG